MALAHRAREGDEAAAGLLAEMVADLDVEEAELLVRSLTRWFQLVNLAEDNDRVRRLRSRELAQAPAARSGSLRDAVRRLAAAGVNADQLGALLAGAELRLVLTAHPDRGAPAHDAGEAGACVRHPARSRRAPQPSRGAGAGAPRLRATVQELWGSDELRAVALTVLDEVRGGLVHFVSTLAETLPLVYRDLEEALAESYPSWRRRCRRCCASARGSAATATATRS